ncbi:hypothetical protein LZ32DRAFT_606243 [Colletotrichum eremochloae]|nr:hypothetical protein LZ32DRAFT_606243 [Colletotrichum eremochloae]
MARGKSNRDPRKGLENRRNGIFKKSNTFYRIYGAQIAVIVRYKDQVEAYESQPGLLKSHAYTSVPADRVKGPDDFDLVRDRTGPDASTTQACVPVATMNSSSAEEYEDIFSPPLLSSSSSNTTTETPSEASAQIQSDAADAESAMDILSRTPPMTLPSYYKSIDDSPSAQAPSRIILPSMLLPGANSQATAKPVSPKSSGSLELHCPRPISIRRKQALLSLAQRFLD